MANQVAKVVREKIVECITCPLCKKLFREATTISECLHTFCRKCIYDKISDEELERCPVCNIYMGCIPLEKLRPDHNLQDLRAKIFPFRKRKVKMPEVSVALPVKRKERSLSSLVVSTPKVSTTVATTGRRTTAAERIAAIFRGPKIDKHVVKDEDSVEDHLESSSSLDRLAKIVHTKRNVKEANVPSSSLAEASQQIRIKGAENGAEPLEGKLDLWKPLNYLVEVANRTKSFKSNTQKVNTKVEHTQIADREDHVVKCKTKEGKRKSKGEDVKKNHDPASSEIERPKKLQRVCRKREPSFVEPSISLQSVLDSTCAEQRRKVGPIWFSLIASEDQEGDMPLPQIPAKYLRIKDGNLPVSFIQKYLMRKLDLSKEVDMLRTASSTHIETAFFSRFMATNSIVFAKISHIRRILSQGFRNGTRLWPENALLIIIFGLQIMWYTIGGSKEADNNLLERPFELEGA